MDYIKNNEENMNGNLLAGENMDAASDKVMQYRNVVLADNFPSYAKWKFIEIMLEKRDDEDSFGFILMKNNNSTKLLNKSASKVVKKLEDAVRHVGDKLVVVEILEGGAAHREGTMKLGDQIVAINNISMNQLTEQMAHHLMKQSGSSVTLCIEYITHFVDFRTDNPTPILVHLKDFFVAPHEITLASQQLSDADEEIIVVDNVYEAGNVDRLGLIQAGDQILEINHVNLRQKSLDDAIRILNSASQRKSASSNPLRQSALPAFSRYLDSTNISSPASSSLQLITFPSTYQFPPSPTNPTSGLVLCKDLYNNLDLLYNFKKATACIRSDDDDEVEDGRRKHPPLVRMKMLHRGNNLSSTERSSSLKSSFAGLDHFRSLSCVSNSFNEDTEKPNWFGEANNVNNKSCRTFSCIQPNEMNKHDVDNEINFNSYFLEKYIQQNHQIKKQLSKESPLYTKKLSVQSHQHQCNNVNVKNMIDSANNSSVVNIEKKTPGGTPDDIRVNSSATFDDISCRNNPLNKELSSNDDDKHVLYQTKTIDNREHNTVTHAANSRTEADSRGEDEVSNITTPSTKQKADPTSFDLTYSVLLTRNHANMSNNFAAGELSGDSCHKSTRVTSLGLTLYNPSDNLGKNIVKSVDENSLVGQTGAVHVGDEVLAVNKIPLHRLSCKQAEDIIENEHCNNENISLTIRKSGRKKTRPSRIFAQESFDSAVGSHNPSFDNVRLYNPCVLNKVTSRSKFVVEAEVHHSLDDLGTNKHPTKYHRSRMDSPQLPTQQPPVRGKFNVASKLGDKNDSVRKNVKVDVNSPARNLKEFHISPETRKNIYRNIKTRGRCMTMDFYKQSIDEDDDAFDFNVNTSENNDNSSVENKVNQPTTFESSLDYIDEPDRNIIRATSKKIEALAEDVDEMLDMIKTSEQSNKNFIKQQHHPNKHGAIEDANCGRGDVERSGENIPHHDDNDKHGDDFIRELPSELKLKSSLDRLEHLLRDIDDVSLFYQSGQFNDLSDKDQVIKKAVSDDTSDVVIGDDYDEKYVTLLSSVDQVQPDSSTNKSSSSSPSDKKLTQLFNFLDLVSDPNENLCQGEDTRAEDSPDRGPVFPAFTCNSSQATTSSFSPTVTTQTPSAGIISGDEAKISNNLVDTDNSDEKNIIIINEKNVNNIKNLLQFLIVSSSLGGTYFESTKLSAQSGSADATSNTNCTFSNKTTNNNADGDDSDDDDVSELSRVTKHLTSKTTPHVLPITVSKHFHNITITKDASADLPAATTSCFCYLPYITSCLVVTPLNSDSNVTTSSDNLHSTVIQISSSAIPLFHSLTSSSPSTFCTSTLLSSSLLSVSQPSLSSLLFLQLPSLKSTASSTSSPPSSSPSTSSPPSSSASSPPSSSLSTSSPPTTSTSSPPTSSPSASSLPMSTPPTPSQPFSSTSFSPSQIPSQSSEDKKCSVARQHVTGNTENKQCISELRDNCDQQSSYGNASHSIDFRKNKLLNSNYFFNAETPQLSRYHNAEKNIHAIDRDIIHRKEVSEKNAEAAIPFDNINAKKAIDNVLAFPNIHKNKFSSIIRNDSAAVNKSHTDNELPQDLRRDSTPSSDYDEWSQMFETIQFSSTESFTDETICTVKNERDSKLVNDISLSLNTIPSLFSFAPPSPATAKTAPPQFAPMHDQSQSAPTINKPSEEIMPHYAQVVKNLKAPPSMAVYEENIKMGGTANERSINDDAVNFNLNNSEVAIVGENCRHGLPKKRLQNNNPTPHQPQIKTRQQRHKQQHLQQFKQRKQDSQQLRHFVRLSQQNNMPSQNVRISHVNPERLSQTPIEIIRAILSKRKDADSFGFGLSNGVHEPGVFVCGIMAGGAADNILQLYDKVLQVNKVNIKNLSSNEVVDLIKKAGDILELVVCRSASTNIHIHL